MRKTLRIALLAAAVAAAACTPIYRNHGWVPTEEDLAKVKVGVDNRISVVEALGAPSAGGVLDESNFYYVRSRLKTVGPRAPVVESREVVAVTFDDNGLVRNVAQLGLEDGRVVAFETRVTDTTVGTNTFLRQLLAGVGGFTPAAPTN